MAFPKLGSLRPRRPHLGDGRPVKATGSEIVSACANPFAKRDRICSADLWRTRLELCHPFGEQARGGVYGSNRKKLVETCGHLDESLKEAPLRRICLDSPARLPRLMGLEKGA